MGHVPTEAEIDAMSEENLEAYLASAQVAPVVPVLGSNDAAAPTSGPLARGGAPRRRAAPPRPAGRRRPWPR